MSPTTLYMICALIGEFEYLLESLDICPDGNLWLCEGLECSKCSFKGWAE